MDEIISLDNKKIKLTNIENTFKRKKDPWKG